MGDTYKISGQAGAVGPNSTARDNTFQQYQEVDRGISPAELSQFLSTLKAAIGATALGAETEADLKVLSEAEELSRQGEVSSALGKLKGASKKALTRAVEIGAPIAIKKVIETLIG